MFGDLGWTDDQVLPYLQQESEAGVIDAMVIFGDMVYWDNGENENSFMRDVSTLSGEGKVPVMVSPGNGDAAANMSRYKQQWAMPGWEQQTGSSYHSFDIGRAHIVGINTEALDYWSAITPTKDRMLRWLAQDLAKANEPATRQQRPWIVVHFHRPAYSTGNTDPRPYEVFEPLMERYGVDLVFAGHVHNQERTFPVFNRTLMPGKDHTRPYHNSRAPVYVVSGNPGNAEETNYFNRGFDEWTAWRSYTFGYSHLTLLNQTAIEVEFFSTNLARVTDKFVLSKDASCIFGAVCTDPQPLFAGTVDGAHGAESVTAAVPPRTDLLELQLSWIDQQAVLAGPVPTAQLDALVELFNATNGTGWQRHDGWLRGDPCSTPGWYGVSCVRVTERTLPHLWNSSSSNVGGVTALHLSSNGLAGQIPTSLGEALAPSLQLLDLSNNRLTGSLPTSLFAMPRLHTLFVEPETNYTEHRLLGSLPASIGEASGLPSLRFLALSRNALTGSIPASLGSLSCHVVHASPSEVGCLIWLIGNQFSGPIPQSMCKAIYNEVYASKNNLTCPIPCLHLGYGNFDHCAEKCVPC
jgi:predicted MPP superfamily phosphohydrolase